MRAAMSDEIVDLRSERTKRTQAERLLSKGKSVIQVAAAIGTTPTTVYSTYGSKQIREWRLSAKK